MTVSDCERRKGSAWQGGEHWGPTTMARLLSLDSARLDSTLRREDPRLGSAQARRPTTGWLAGWVGLAHREPTGPPTATIHRNRAPSNPSDSHSFVCGLATSTGSAREGWGRRGIGRRGNERQENLSVIRVFFYKMRCYEIIA